MMHHRYVVTVPGPSQHTGRPRRLQTNTYELAKAYAREVHGDKWAFETLCPHDPDCPHV